MLTEEFSLFRQINEGIFAHFYPAKNSTGFVERNLSVNFATAYEQLHRAKGETCFSWFEFQFGPSNNLHFDACIVNVTTKELFLVESKRFKTVPQGTREILQDVYRICTFPVIEELATRLSNPSDYKIYGLILADVWVEPAPKLGVYNAFVQESFLHEELSTLENLCYYHSRLTLPESDAPGWSSSRRETYRLVGFSWQVSPAGL